MYVDVHCHLDDKAFTDLDALIARAKGAAVKAIISNGTNQASNEAVFSICERFSLVRPAYGLYPTEPFDARADAAVFAWIREQAISGKFPPIAIGEIGLDGVQPVSEEQRIRFRAAIALAQELRLPLIIHSRKAEQEVFDELSGIVVPVIMHCFGGNKKLILEGVKRGYYFSIPASIKRSEHFQLMASLVPLSQIFTETDAPYLSADKETFPNEPSAVVGSVERIAAIKKINVEECRQALFMNYQRFFSI